MRFLFLILDRKISEIAKKPIMWIKRFNLQLMISQLPKSIFLLRGEIKMSKNPHFIIICFCLSFFVACSVVNVDVNENDENVLTTGDESTINSEIEETKPETVDPFEIESASLLYLNSNTNENDERYLSLLDLMTGEIIETLYLNRNEVVVNITQNFSLPYFIVLKAVADTDLTGYIWVSGIGDELFLNLENSTMVLATRYLVVYDADLNEVDSFDYPEIPYVDETIIYDENDLMIYYRRFQTRTLYSHNVKENNTQAIVEFPEKIFPGRFANAGKGRLSFVANVLETCSSYIGHVDIHTGEFRYVAIDKTINQMIANGDYVLFTEALSPPGFCGSDEPTGEIIIYHLPTNEMQIINVDNFGDFDVEVIANRYVLVISLDGIDVYDLNSGRLLLGQALSTHLEHIDFEPSDDGEYVPGIYPHFHRIAQLTDTVYAVIYNDGVGGFHVELLDIGELDE